MHELVAAGHLIAPVNVPRVGVRWSGNGLRAWIEESGSPVAADARAMQRE